MKRRVSKEREKAAIQPLDADSSVPLYLQIKNMILANIASGDWRIGAKLPTEAELVAALGVSRMTVNRALRELTDDRILKRRARLGTFISERPTHGPLFGPGDIAQEITSRGETYSSRVLMLDREKANRFIADRLDLPYGSEVHHSRIVHISNTVPVQLEERWVNPAAASAYLEQDFTAATPHAFLERTAPMTEVEQSVHAVVPRTAELEILQVESRTPCLLVVRRVWSGETVVSTVRCVSPGERHSLGSRYKIPI